jgi:hypothetical protein
MLAVPLLENRVAAPVRFPKLQAARVLGIAALLLAAVFLLVGTIPPVTTRAMVTGYWYGVSLGGWLLMEVNPFERSAISSPDVRPKWMFDQFEAAAELDFVIKLRAEHSDQYAIQTMRNHWEGFITNDALDAAVALGVNVVRIPVGYWIADAPVGGSSPLEYGISPEGFVTGGLNYLRTMLGRLRDRGISAMIDIHSLPCNSHCVSDGLNCKTPLAYTPDAKVSDIEKCEGGLYPTSRPREKANGQPNTWGDVGLESTAKIANWIASLPEEERATVVGLQLANEPALNTGGFNEAIQSYYTAAVSTARSALPASTPLIMSFLYPNDWGVPTFIKGLVDGGAGKLLIDWHWYLNWAAWDYRIMPWAEIHERACTTAQSDWENKVPGLEIVLGEWSLATNHDAPLDLSDVTVRRELAQLFEEQKLIFTTSRNVVGSFFWTLRMGSGWDPRPTSDFPWGRQLEGTDAARSLPGFPFQVWSLLEMAERGIASPLNAPAPPGTCEQWKRPEYP